MKYQFYISQKWRKLTAVLLLLNFFVTPLISAFPQEVCNGVCEMESIIHECASETPQMMEMTCCDMMDMNSIMNNTSSACEMQLTDMNCALVAHSQINPVYLIPKTIDSKIEFVQITTISIEEDNSGLELFELVQDFSQRKEPPIFLTNSVFLI
jgi:hypothetical protein